MTLMSAPESGVRIRMYRQGHGDCFLLAFPSEDNSERPIYMLIDCGFKPGSQIVRKRKKVTIDRVVKDIAKATGKEIDIVVITHEHQDHVNGFGKFKGFVFGQAWFAWTEDPSDDLANDLRKRHKDQLLGLLRARNELSMSIDLDRSAGSLNRIDELLSLEFGNETADDNESIDKTVESVDVNTVFGAASDPLKSKNKKAMALVKKLAKNNLRFIEPHAEVLSVEHVSNLRIYPLGPPRSEDLLKDEDPVGKEGFPGHDISASLSFFAAAASLDRSSVDREMPFNPSFSMPKSSALIEGDHMDFYNTYYGEGQDVDADIAAECLSNASWRRIDDEWLYAAEAFALKLNRGINNTSLVLAFELTNSGKVLLFAADAQLGNWKSWTDGEFEVEGKSVTARDLLGRTVVYKTGHHGSHNATLKGTLEDDYANLSWMAQGDYSNEFSAFITAHNEWAVNKAKWNHPLPSIKRALRKKAGGRVFQVDENKPRKPDSITKEEWDEFMNSHEFVSNDLYLELAVLDA